MPETKTATPAKSATLAAIVDATATPATPATPDTGALLELAKADFMTAATSKVKRVGDDTSMALQRTIVRYANIVQRQSEPAASLTVMYDDGTSASFVTACARLLGVNGRSIKPVGFAG